MPRRPRGAPFTLDHDTERTFGPLPDDCRVWRWGKTTLGYGVLRTGPRTIYAHRFFFEQFFGPIPDGCVLDHKCENTSCVNPRHLEIVKQAENVRRHYSNRKDNGNVP